MSTYIPPAAAEAAEPVTVADLEGYFHEAGRPAERWRVGGEFEKIGVARATGRQLTYDQPGGVRDVLAGLVERFEWEPFYEGVYLTALLRDGATVTIEPGGQVELSTAPAEHVGQIAEELHRHLDELRAVSDPAAVAWLGVGVTPFSRAGEIPLVPRERYGVMADYLPARASHAAHMMRATASTQATFDYADEADAARKFTVALKLGPVVNALWGNAPLYGGRSAGVVSFRGRVWQGMDPDRSGLLTDLLGEGFSFAGWVDYLLDVPMMFTHRAGRYRDAGGRTFRDFLEHGIDGRFPTREDWEIHLTTVFPEVRLKKFIEVRGADANRPGLALAVPTLWKGLLYDDDGLAAAEELAAAIVPAELPDLFDAACRDGLRAAWDGRTLRDWNRATVTIAADGLRRQAAERGHPDERRYLEPVLTVLEAGQSPGAQFLAAVRESAPEPAAVLCWFDCHDHTLR